MKLKDLKPGDEVAVGTPKDRERGSCQRAFVVEAGGWVKCQRSTILGTDFFREGNGKHGVAIAHRNSIFDAPKVQWAPRVVTPQSIQCLWADFLKEQGE